MEGQDFVRNFILQKVNIRGKEPFGNGTPSRDKCVAKNSIICVTKTAHQMKRGFIIMIDVRTHKIQRMHNGRDN